MGCKGLWKTYYWKNHWTYLNWIVCLARTRRKTLNSRRKSRLLGVHMVSSWENGQLDSLRQMDFYFSCLCQSPCMSSKPFTRINLVKTEISATFTRCLICWTFASRTSVPSKISFRATNLQTLSSSNKSLSFYILLPQRIRKKWRHFADSLTHNFLKIWSKTASLASHHLYSLTKLKAKTHKTIWP